MEFTPTRRLKELGCAYVEMRDKLGTTLFVVATLAENRVRVGIIFRGNELSFAVGKDRLRDFIKMLNESILGD